MKLISFNYCVFNLFSKKPMATHQASINIQEPTKFKLEATRTRVEYHFHLEPNSKQALKSERNSKTQLYKFEQELLQAPGIRIRAHSNQTPSQRIWTMADSAAQTTNPTVDDAAIYGLKVIFSLIPLILLSLLSFWNFKSWNLTPYAYFWTSGVRHPSAASFQSKIFLSWPTSSRKSYRFNLLWRK